MEAAATLAKMNNLTPEQTLKLADTLSNLLPYYGSATLLYQAVTGQTLSGQPLDTAERWLSGILGAIPVGAAAYGKISEFVAATGLAAAKGAAVPKGFSNVDDFARFGTDARDGLAKAGYGNVEPILQGSAVTGQSFKTGQAFDVGRVSDFDIALAGPELLQRAQSLGIGLRSGGTRTGPLSARDLQALGLKDLASKLSAQAGREVNFMIYDSAATAASRAPSLVLPK